MFSCFEQAGCVLCEGFPLVRRQTLQLNTHVEACFLLFVYNSRPEADIDYRCCVPSGPAVNNKFGKYYMQEQRNDVADHVPQQELKIVRGVLRGHSRAV